MDRMHEIYRRGKQGFDTFTKELGRMMAETIVYVEREEISGPDYQPFSAYIQKWASQPGLVYIPEFQAVFTHYTF